jgi:predicted Zn finger-like uncharacterized protein
MPPAKVPCPACQAVLAVPADKPGIRVRCPKCQKVFTPSVASEEAPPMAEPIPEPAPTPPPLPADDNDFYKRLAAADDPIAAAGQARKPQPQPGESGNPLPLDDDEPPPAKGKTKPARKAAGAVAGGIVGAPKTKRTRDRDDDDDEETANPNTTKIVALSAMGLLALAGVVAGALAVGGAFDRKKDTDTAANSTPSTPAKPDTTPVTKPEPKPEPKPELKTKVDPEPQKPVVPNKGPIDIDDVPPDVPLVPNPRPPGKLPRPKMPFDPPVGPPVGPAPIPAPFPEPFPPPIGPPGGFPQPPGRFPPFDQPAPEPGKAKLTFPAATPVELKPAPLAQESVEVKLPSKITDAVVGGGGRYWCLLLPDAKQVAVFDVNQAKVARYLPLASGTAHIAAGMNKLMVAYPDTEVVVRYDLTTFEKDVTARLPFQGTVKGLALGSASAGPLLVCYSKGGGGGGPPGWAQGTVAFLDLTTLKALDAGPDAANGLNVGGGFGGDHFQFRARPDGRAFVGWTGFGGPNGLNSYTLSETGVKVKNSWDVNGPATLAEDGTLFTLSGVYSPDLKPIGKKDVGFGGSQRIPAQRGPLYLTLSSDQPDFRPNARITVKASVHTLGDDRALVTIPEFAVREIPGGIPVQPNFGGTPADRRVLFCPDGKLIASIDASDDKLLLRKFDLDAMLEKSGVDYLFAASRPPAAEPGKPFKYPIAVKSKKGGTTFKLDAGPDGMKIAADGTVTWDVPKGWSGSESVIVTISDKSGQEVFHTFTLTPAAPAPAGGGGNPAVANPPQPEPNPQPRPNPRPKGPANPPADPKPGLVRPAANPAKFTPTKAADNAELKLPGSADMTCLGGGGRYVLFRIPKVRQVAVLDVCEGKVVRYLPLPEDGALVAAGNEHVFIVAPTANVIQRWNLTTFEKELTVANPLGGTPKQALVGHSTDGPLFLAGAGRDGVGLLDGKTLKKLELPAGAGWGRLGWPDGGSTVRVSGDGRVFGHWCPGLSPSGLRSVVIADGSVKSYDQHTTVGAILPGPDGTLFTAGGLYTPELKAIGGKGGYQYWHHAPMPAAHGKFYLSIPPDDLPAGLPGGRGGGPKVLLKMVGEEKSLVELGNLAGFDIPKDHNQTAARGLQLYDRVFLIPNAKALVVLNGSADRIHIHRFDLDAMLDKAGIDYLFVTSRPPGAVRGGAFTYKPEVKSKKGGVTVKLDAGPDGMRVAADGTVTWDVPADFGDASASVILTISDKSGQETFHTFTLPVANKK